MGESGLSWTFASEAELLAAAGECARCWAEGTAPTLCIGLEGDLGAGKTTWVRGMLRGLGYEGRVPSPTYTLVEPYEIGGLQAVHVDLYRLTSVAELDGLGLRDYLSVPHTWLLVEWPERHEALAAGCDLTLRFALAGEGRSVTLTGGSDLGRRMQARARRNINSSNKP